MFNLFLTDFIIPAVDWISIKVSNLFSKYPPHHNKRWFFIHTVVNGLVAWYNLEDLIDCINNREACAFSPMSEGAFFATDLMIKAHFYHMIFFFYHLKPAEWFHHMIMCGFNGVSVYYFKNKAQAASAFFLSGLPGMVDYFLLWCVKMGFIDSKIEKKAYVYLATYLRSPGTAIVTYLSVPLLYRKDFSEIDFDWWYAFLVIFLNFWNGQYYMMKTCIDYGKKF